VISLRQVKAAIYNNNIVFIISEIDYIHYMVAEPLKKIMVAKRKEPQSMT